MNRTKVRVPRSLLDYRQGIAGRVHEYREERLRTFDGSIEPCPPRPEVTLTDRAGLVAAPRIESLWPELYLKEGG